MTSLVRIHKITAMYVVVVVAGFCLTQAAMADGTFTPVSQPTLQVSKAAGEIKIDDHWIRLQNRLLLVTSACRH